MKKIICLMLMILSLCSVCAAAEQEDNSKNNSVVAVIPYYNASEEEKGYIDDAVQEGYTNYFSKSGFIVVPAAEVVSALDKTGYTTEDEELPDKDQLKAVADATKADYVVAMEITSLNASRHVSFFQSKVTAKGKLSYKVYSAKMDKLYSFKTSSSDDNKTVFGGVGYKSPLVNVLNNMMEQANDKIQAFIAENDGVEINQ